MNKDKRHMEHPEIEDIKNICEVSPKTKITEGVCNKISHSNNQSLKRPIKKK